VGSAPLSYQWYSNTNTSIAGATNSTLSISNVQTSGSYDVVVSNSYGSVTSSIVKLTVLPNPPASLTATAGVKSVALTYTAAKNATFYTIYRSKVSGGPYTKIATTASTKYTDLNVVTGTTYYYVVADTDGVNLSGNSTQASATPR
jgi:fibronectin type 3 domain-containing protein